MGPLGWLLAAAATLIAAYLLARFIRNEHKELEKQVRDAQQRSKKSFEDLKREMQDQKSQSSLRVNDRDGLIRTMDTVVAQITFSQVQLKVSRVQVGEREVETPIPTDTIMIRPMQGSQDLIDLLPSEHAYDDDIFFVKLATNDLLIRKFIGVEAVFESNLVRPEQMMVVLADVSGSMEGQRMSYMVSMMRKLAVRASLAKASTVVIPFSGQPISHRTERAQSVEEYKNLHDRLPSFAKLDGGTNIPGALEAGIDIFRQLDEYENGQIILITDGNTNVDPKYVKQMLAEYSLTLHTVCIGEYSPSLKSASNEFTFVELDSGYGLFF